VTGDLRGFSIAREGAHINGTGMKGAHRPGRKCRNRVGQAAASGQVRTAEAGRDHAGATLWGGWVGERGAMYRHVAGGLGHTGPGLPHTRPAR